MSIFIIFYFYLIIGILGVSKVGHCLFYLHVIVLLNKKISKMFYFLNVMMRKEVAKLCHLKNACLFDGCKRMAKNKTLVLGYLVASAGFDIFRQNIYFLHSSDNFSRKSFFFFRRLKNFF